MDMKKPVKVTFAEGCFDNFEGNQEELDELVNQIQTMFSTMTREEIEAQSRAVDLEELADALDTDPEVIEFIQGMAETSDRKLH